MTDGTNRDVGAEEDLDPQTAQVANHLQYAPQAARDFAKPYMRHIAAKRMKAQSLVDAMAEAIEPDSNPA